MRRLALLLLAAVSLRAQTAPDIIFTHGKIYTADPARRFVEALAVGGERITAIGTNAEIEALAGPKTKRFNLEGHVVIPGINDAHTHQTPEGELIKMVTSRDPTWTEIEPAITSAWDESAGDAWIMGEIGPTLLRDPQVTAEALDKASHRRAVMLVSWTGHGAIFSSTALRMLRVSDSAPDPLGGWFERDANGKLTGKAFEYAEYAIERRLADGVNEDEAVRQLGVWAETAHRYGITSTQNMSLQSLSRYEKNARHANAPLRIRMIRFGNTDTKARDVREAADLPATHRERPLTVISGTKWILDGTPVEQGAALRTNYKDTQANGKLNFPPEQIAAMIDESLKNNDQLLLHVAGDRTAAAVLDALKAAAPEIRTRRVRFEHGDGLLPDLIPTAKAMGVVVVQNPTHIIAKGAYPGGDYLPLRSLIEAGIPVALGSDGPMNPFLNILLATTAFGKESITREQAVDAYTRVSAFAELQEKEKGTLTAGKLADLAVLSQDIFTAPADRLPDTISELTMIGGKIVRDTGVVKR
ncbi:MAG TPA: amidohydrolase family protein [Thermoanaerobaculia bacterium]|jgi:predicted amidohydrolase YtcJ|nr:amidohydrolase family protein [Thermoanaerobaculia bacterium]